MNKRLLALLPLVVLVVFATQVFAAPYDFGGETVRISGVYHAVDSQTFGINFYDARGQGHLEDVEEMFNVKIQWVDDGTAGNADQFIANVLAGDPVADIQLLLRYPHYQKVAAEGLLTPLNDILDDDYFANKPHVYAPTDFFWFGDDLYGFSMIDVGGWCLFWNKDLFAREGLPDPYELVENEEWDWETFREICRLATKDTTGDGEIDQWGCYFAAQDGGFEAYAALMSFNNAAIAKKIDGKYTVTLDAPETIEAIEFLRTLMFEDKTVVEVENFYDFFSGKYAMVFTAPWWFHYCANPDYMADDVGILPHPFGYSGSPETLHCSYGATNWAWVIPKTTKHDPRALIELYDALYMASYDYMIEDAEERLVGIFAQYITDRRDLEFYRDNISDHRLNPYFDDFFFPGHKEWFGELSKEETNVAAHIASVKEMLQARLDDVLNK